MICQCYLSQLHLQSVSLSQVCVFEKMDPVSPLSLNPQPIIPYLALTRRPVEKAMAPHSSTLAWKIPWMEEPGGLQSMGLLRVGHDWATSLSLFTFMHWRRKWQPTPVFLPWESQGMAKPGGLPSMGLHRVGHYWSDLAAAAADVQ